MRTAAYKVGVASDRRRRKNVPLHILLFYIRKVLVNISPVQKAVCLKVTGIWQVWFEKGVCKMYEKEIEQLQAMIDESNRIVFFGGAGVSTESNIPDFRSATGIYHQKYKYSPEQVVSHSFL